jgi:hypothetical protein
MATLPRATQQALNLAYRYLPTAKSCVSAPGVHAAALRNPEMFGGPFLGLPENAAAVSGPNVDGIENRRGTALRVAEQLRAFNIELQHANGYSLDGLRAQLSGQVELVYDLNSQPKIRLLEETFIIASSSMRWDRSHGCAT